ncbi:glycoside hydrolase family 95-like protein [Formosa sp. 4Alg 33]
MLFKAWDNGAYSGLVARGNFEISVIWKNGKAYLLKFFREAEDYVN